MPAIVKELIGSGATIAVAAREEPKVCRLSAGGSWIRTSSTRAPCKGAAAHLGKAIELADRLLRGARAVFDDLVDEAELLRLGRRQELVAFDRGLDRLQRLAGVLDVDKVTVEGLGRYRLSLPQSTAEATQILRRGPGSGRVPVERAAHPIGIGPRLSTTALV